MQFLFVGQLLASGVPLGPDIAINEKKMSPLTHQSANWYLLNNARSIGLMSGSRKLDRSRRNVPVKHVSCDPNSAADSKRMMNDEIWNNR
jgi:hypothetical protein